MGRNIKYVTEEQKIAARKERQLRYYNRNKEKIDKSNLDRYYRNKEINNKVVSEGNGGGVNVSGSKDSGDGGGSILGNFNNLTTFDF